MTWTATLLGRAGETLRAQANRLRPLRFASVVIALLSGALGWPIVAAPRPLLVWNASASTPVGLYAIGSPSDLRVGDYVVARQPVATRRLAAARHYLPANVPLVKRVAAIPGDRVCALGQDISINGFWVAERRVADAPGRRMPWWSGCIQLRQGAHFLLLADEPASFDGRYFGPTERKLIIGKAHLLWAR